MTDKAATKLGTTAREIADRNLEHYRKALHLARTKGQGEAAVRGKLDEWLEYRYAHQADGTLDEEQK
jgi:hypothetical protein